MRRLQQFLSPGGSKDGPPQADDERRVGQKVPRLLASAHATLHADRRIIPLLRYSGRFATTTAGSFGAAAAPATSARAAASYDGTWGKVGEHKTRRGKQGNRRGGKSTAAGGPAPAAPHVRSGIFSVSRFSHLSQTPARPTTTGQCPRQTAICCRWPIAWGCRPCCRQSQAPLARRSGSHRHRTALRGPILTSCPRSPLPPGVRQGEHLCGRKPCGDLLSASFPPLHAWPWPACPSRLPLYRRWRPSFAAGFESESTVMEPGTYRIVLLIDQMENTGSRHNKGEVFVR